MVPEPEQQWSRAMVSQRHAVEEDAQGGGGAPNMLASYGGGGAAVPQQTTAACAASAIAMTTALTAGRTIATAARVVRCTLQLAASDQPVLPACSSRWRIVSWLLHLSRLLKQRLSNMTVLWLRIRNA